MYFQDTFEEHCLTTGAPTHLSFFSATCTFILLITNIPGNTLVVLAVAIDPYRVLQSPFNYLMVNLAVADLIVGTGVCPLAIDWLIKEGQDKKISTVEVHLLHIMFFISCSASLFSIASLGVERCLAMWDPLTYRVKVTGKRILITVAAIWVLSLTLPCVYFEVGFITYTFIFANTSVVITVIIAGFTYTMMVYMSKQRTKLFRKSTTAIANNFGARVASKSFSRNKLIHLENKITKMFLIVMLALFCCYGPSTVMIYTMSFCESCSCVTLHWFRDLQSLFIMMNSSVNFFCYALRSRKFRNAFAYILLMQNREPRAASHYIGARRTSVEVQTS